MGMRGGDTEAKRMLREDMRNESDMDQIIEAYEFSRPSQEHDAARSIQQFEAESIYSQMTGMPRRMAEPRIPVRDHTTGSRFSLTTLGSSSSSNRVRELRRVPVPVATEAEVFAASVRDDPQPPKGLYWITPPQDPVTEHNNPFFKLMK